MKQLLLILFFITLSYGSKIFKEQVQLWDSTESVNVTTDSSLEVRTDTGSFVNVGEDGVRYEMDNLGRYFVFLDIEHHMKHEGRFFDYHHTASAVGNGDSLVFLIATEDTTRWTHFLFEVESLKEANGMFFEGSSVSSVGTALTEVNVNRNSNISSLTQIFFTPTLVSHGTDTIWKDHWGDTKKIGGDRLHDEIVLKQSDSCTFRIISAAADNNIDVRFFWYELLNR